MVEPEADQFAAVLALNGLEEHIEGLRACGITSRASLAALHESDKAEQILQQAVASGKLGHIIILRRLIKDAKNSAWGVFGSRNVSGCVQRLVVGSDAGVSALTNASRRTRCSNGSAVARGSVCTGTTALPTAIPPPVFENGEDSRKDRNDKTARKDCNDESRLVHWGGEWGGIGLDLRDAQGVGANGGYRQPSSTRHGTAYSDKLELVQRWAQEALQLTPLPTTKSATSTSRGHKTMA